MAKYMYYADINEMLQETLEELSEELKLPYVTVKELWEHNES